jgi:hypothetical protein
VVIVDNEFMLRNLTCRNVLTFDDDSVVSCKFDNVAHQIELAMEGSQISVPTSKINGGYFPMMGLDYKDDMTCGYLEVGKWIRPVHRANISETKLLTIKDMFIKGGSRG